MMSTIPEYTVVKVTVAENGDPEESKSITYVLMDDGTALSFYGRACSLRDTFHVHSYALEVLQGFKGRIWSTEDDDDGMILFMQQYVMHVLGCSALFHCIDLPSEIMDIEVYNDTDAVDFYATKVAHGIRCYAKPAAITAVAQKSY